MKTRIITLLLYFYLCQTYSIKIDYTAQNNPTGKERTFKENYTSSEHDGLEIIKANRDLSDTSNEDSSSTETNTDERAQTTSIGTTLPTDTTTWKNITTTTAAFVTTSNETSSNTSSSTGINTDEWEQTTTINITLPSSATTREDITTTVDFVTTPTETTSLSTQTTTTEDTTTPDDGNIITVTPQPQSVTCPFDVLQGNVVLVFEETPAETWAIPNQLCLQVDYTPVRRYCFKNGTWGKIQGSCSDTVLVTNTTSALYRLRSKDPVIALNETLYLVNSNNFIDEMEPIDVYFISEILGKASQDIQVAVQPDNFHEIIDKVMGSKKDVLQSSQQLLNATDNILYNLDALLLQTKSAKFSSLPSLLVHTVDTSTGVIGGMIKNNGKGDTFTSFQVVPLYDHNSTEELEKADFEMAFQVPLAFTQNQDYYYITLFHNDYLFNQEVNNSDFSVGSWIISILIPDITTDNNSNIRIYFKEFTSNLQRHCDHWNYGKDENNSAIKGQWTSDSDVIKFKESFYICEINHTTHFGMLVSGSFANNAVLDYLTIFGSILSVVGIAIIFLTALFFKNWRNNPTNIIILNVSVCLLLVIILLFIADRINEGTFCIIIGILLHYMILAQFCWMLMISYSNFRRLRLTLHYHIENVVLKYCIISWGIPIIIVSIVSGLSVQTYNKNSEKNSSEICYPKGMYFKLGLLMPVGIILTVNLIIYLLIIKAITATNFDLRKHSVSKSYSQQKSIFLLFFMLGITWIFGFLAAFIDSIVFTYLFCTTATYQGFVIFLFYILDSTNTKELWKNKLQKILNKKKKPKRISVSEFTLQSQTQTKSDS